MHEGPRVQIAIAPSLPIGEGYQSFVWIIHIRDIPKLWDDTYFYKKIQAVLRAGTIIQALNMPVFAIKNLTVSGSKRVIPIGISSCVAIVQGHGRYPGGIAFSSYHASGRKR
jgi:hypothetical protein